eukprot:Nk52_evm32s252 gene=Nk52_evmTU32s252
MVRDYCILIVLSLTLILQSSAPVVANVSSDSRCVLWMQDNADVLGSKNFAEITLPGTHNSHMTKITDYKKFSYNIKNDDEARLVNLLKGGAQAFPDTIKEFSAGWTINQEKDISTQLCDGVRFFDIKVGKVVDPASSSDNVIYSVHTYVGPQLKEIIDALGDFVVNNPKEVVVARFHEFYGFSTTDHETVYGYMKSAFQDRMFILPPGSSGNPFTSTTLKQLQDIGQNVIVLYDDYSISRPGLLNFNFYDMPWANAYNVSYLEKTLPVLYSDSTFEVKGFQWILTPTSQIISNAFLQKVPPRTLKELSLPMLNDAFPSFMGGFKSVVSSVFVDFYDSTSIVKYCVERSGGSISPKPSSTSTSANTATATVTVTPTATGSSSSANPDVDPGSASRCSVVSMSHIVGFVLLSIFSFL